MKKMNKIFYFAAAVSIAVLSVSCGGSAVKKTDVSPKKDDFGDFFTKQARPQEVFRVYLSSDRYEVKQLKYSGTIERGEDKGGDSYIMEELKKSDIIEETRESVVQVKLWPDSGRVEQIRPIRAVFLYELDKLIQDDIQRWNLLFPKKYVSPTTFEIRYKVVLRKTQSDEEILKGMRQKMKDTQ